jgi:hypothetical protein
VIRDGELWVPVDLSAHLREIVVDALNGRETSVELFLERLAEVPLVDEEKAA